MSASNTSTVVPESTITKVSLTKSCSQKKLVVHEISVFILTGGYVGGFIRLIVTPFMGILMFQFCLSSWNSALVIEKPLLMFVTLMFLAQIVYLFNLIIFSKKYVERFIKELTSLEDDVEEEFSNKVSCLQKIFFMLKTPKVLFDKYFSAGEFGLYAEYMLTLQEVVEIIVQVGNLYVDTYFYI